MDMCTPLTAQHTHHSHHHPTNDNDNVQQQQQQRKGNRCDTKAQDTSNDVSWAIGIFFLWFLLISLLTTSV